MNMLLQLLLQIAVILVTCRAVGYLFRFMKQPQVVGDMIAGILLGPSLLGWLAPSVSLWLFPAESLVHLNTLSQVGLVLFMFLVGLELDPKLLRGNGHAAVFTSHVSIIAPFFLGSLLALYLYPRLSDQSVGFVGFTLFIGAAMSVTAFPVLARILQERQLLTTKVGAITIACAAVDDVTAWAILAGVIALVRSSALPLPLWMTLAGSALYILFVFFGLRPLLSVLGRAFSLRGRVTQDLMALILLTVLASAFITEWLGIHALFGAFCVGAVMPKERAFVHEVNEKLEGVTVVLLLPLFFANAGLRTSIGLVSGVEMWSFVGLILLAAVAGKFGGSMFAARLTGQGWRESAALGILMNTRGLMELVILTIGLDIGVISPALFAMMVIMALTTTFMTTPVLQWLYPVEEMRKLQSSDTHDDDYTVIIPVSLPSSGPMLAKVAQALTPASQELRLYGVHLKRSDEGGSPLTESARTETALEPLIHYAAEQAIDLHPAVYSTFAPGHDIADIAYVKRGQLILMGWHKPLLSSRILGGVVNDVLQRSELDVAIYLERSLVPWTRVVVPLHSLDVDAPALKTGLRIAHQRGLPLQIVDQRSVPEEHETDALAELLKTHQSTQIHIDVQQHSSMEIESMDFQESDLILLNLPAGRHELPNIGERYAALATSTQADFLIWREGAA